MFNKNIVGGGNQTEALMQIVDILRKEMSYPDNTVEENAFYLGGINLAAALIEAFDLSKDGVAIGRMCFDYDKVKESYEEVFGKIGEPKFEKVGNKPQFHDIIRSTPADKLEQLLEEELERRKKERKGE
jgi:hypothetical protein